MFQRKRLISRFWQKIQTKKLKLLALALFIAGAGMASLGYAKLSETGTHSYELQPVVTDCHDNQPQEESLFVDVGGAVEKPGLYQLKADSRIGDALELAGGISSQADSSYVASQLNTAKVLTDGDKIFIPTKGEMKQNSTTATGTNSKLLGKEGELTSINTASKSELMELPQIGDKRAEDIISSRPYQSVDDLVEMEVITTSIMDEISELIST